ncbi:unnamed protein product [Rotaria sordida]|uniref:Uncharacterized protein n=1 Tax=Rotaria sordida TaxID=392033 RepID=A0A813ZBG1_9BILA|nr:unnamed protein product [Rotaria sordida]CAF1446740.1 unnamed protein product [Rotaria sordida]
MSNIQDQLHTKTSDDLVTNVLSDHVAPYRPLSAKRPRDPSQRKNVSFNDVPIVHEVPLHDTMRNSNCDTYRSWTYTDVTPSSSLISPFSSSQILPPFNSTNAATQKLNAQRLSNALYSSTNSTTSTRLPDWIIRTKTTKSTDEHHTNLNSPLVIVNTHDERIIKNSSNSQQVTSDNTEEKKYSYRSAVVPDAEHYRTLPFTYVPLSESASTYTSMLSTNFNPSNQSSHDQSSTGHTRIRRSRSATVPITVTHSSIRNHDNVSITPIRTAATTALSNSLLTSSSSSSRAVLKPSTIAFQCSQPATPTANACPTLVVTNTTATTSKSPQVSSRLNSSPVHSRLTSSTNRPLSSTIKYAYAHPTTDSILKSSPTVFPRSRSANILTTKRNLASPAVMLEGQSGGTNHTNIYATTTTTKRNPNTRQPYGSHYMHHVLLPANIN